MKSQDIGGLFRQTAQRVGGAVAIEQGSRRITYRELDSSIKKLTDCLCLLGVVKGDVIGILSHDTIDVTTGILATLRAGGIFCPLDPSFPQKRLESMLARVAPRVLLVGGESYDKWKILGADGVAPARVVLFDGLEAQHQSLAATGPDFCLGTTIEEDAFRLRPEDACSVYFTSGTTGKPKGIVGRLKGIDHFVKWEIEALGIGEGTRVSQLASPSFDGFLKDVFVPLCAGGVVSAPERRQVVQEAGRLIDWVDVEGVEVLHCVPSVLRGMLNEGLEERYFGELRWVVLAGEALAPADVKRWKEVFGERIGLVNLYGPTETTVTKLYYFVQAGDEERPSIPIGKPMPGAAALVVDRNGEPCDIGDVGEIYIRTPYCALGYYGEPELTREVFVQNPFSEDKDDIIYKTGDYGRLLKDGNLEYLGRRDQQVKVRGVRVELGEIENVVRGCEGVRDVAVVDREDGNGIKYLCAYVVLEKGTGIGKVREHVGRYVPESMMPGGYVEMKELPRTLNGKIDRKALPSVQEARGERRREGRGRGRTAVEEIVGGIWEEVLRLEEVGEEENFFELGGHSLLATQIISRVREALKVELPLRVLFEAPTVGEFSRRVEKEIGRVGLREESGIPVVKRDGPLPLSYAQQRMWMLEQLSQGRSAFNMPMGIRLRGQLNVVALEQTVGEIIRRHEILRTRFVVRNGEPVQEVGEAGKVRLNVVDVSAIGGREQEWEVEGIAGGEAGKAFDLSKGPLVRIVVVRLGAEEHVVICTMHHLGGDAWSFEVLKRELSHLYGRFKKEGGPSLLPGLAIQYGDYAVWQRKWLEGEVLEERVGYWKKRLAGAPRELRLPQKRRRGELQSFQGARQRIDLGEELSEELRKLSRREGVTLYMTMLSAFLVLLYQYSGEQDLVVGSVIANREREEVEKLIGFIANTIILRVEMGGGASFREVLRWVRERCLEAYAHQLPPEKLMEENGVGGGKGSLFAVWFQMEQAGREKLELSGLQWETYEVERANARFDLSLVMVEKGNSIVGEMEYDTRIFEDRSVSQMLVHLRKIIKAMMTDPETELASLSLTTEQENEQLRCAFSVDLEG